MKDRNDLSTKSLFTALALTALIAACASNKEGKEEEESERLSLSQMPGPARATAEKMTAGGTVEKIDRENEHGKVVYDVEANVGGQHVEYTITEDGTILGTETQTTFDALPEPVRAAATKYFGGTDGLTCMKCVEDGTTKYEVAGQKAGKKAEATFDATGKILEEE
jgi:uncharacterized membrane protein YkoI